MNSMYKLVVFDLDGTLADTISDLANSVNNALKENNMKTHKTEDYKFFVGNGADRLIELSADTKKGTETFTKIKQGFEDYYSKHICDYTKEYKGINELLAKLSEDDILTAVLSNKPDKYVPPILKKLYPNHHFEYALGQSEKYKRKPDPEALLMIMKNLDVEKKGVLYVGDSDVDVLTAHNAGVKACAVSWGFRPVSELKNAGADFIVDTAEELYKIIKE